MGESRLAVVAALVANLAIAVLKLIAGLIASSAAMLAEAAHSFSDVGNQILLLVGMARADRPPTPDHPFGTGKAAYFWPFMVAILLFGVAGAYSFIEGIDKLRHPHPLEDIRLSLIILAVSFAIEVGSLVVAIRQARKGPASALDHTVRQGPVARLRAFLESNRDAALLTVLVEDSLALLGLPVAAAALLLAKTTGHPEWDGAGSIVIGILLMGFAMFLGSRIARLLLGVGLSSGDRAVVKRVLTAEGAVAKVRVVQSMFLGPQSVLLAVEVEMKPGLAGKDITAALRRLEKELTGALPVLKYVYLEPHSGTERP